MEKVIKDLKKIETLISKNAGIVIGTEAVNHFTENFDELGLPLSKRKSVHQRKRNKRNHKPKPRLPLGEKHAPL